MYPPPAESNPLAVRQRLWVEGARGFVCGFSLNAAAGGMPAVAASALGGPLPALVAAEGVGGCRRDGAKACLVRTAHVVHAFASTHNRRISTPLAQLERMARIDEEVAERQERLCHPPPGGYPLDAQATGPRDKTPARGFREEFPAPLRHRVVHCMIVHMLSPHFPRNQEALALLRGFVCITERSALWRPSRCAPTRRSPRKSEKPQRGLHRWTEKPLCVATSYRSRLLLSWRGNK